MDGQERKESQHRLGREGRIKKGTERYMNRQIDIYFYLDWQRVI